LCGLAPVPRPFRARFARFGLGTARFARLGLSTARFVCFGLGLARFAPLGQVPARCTLLALAPAWIARLALLAAGAALLAPAPAWAAEHAGAAVAVLSSATASARAAPAPGLPWGLPFLGLLVSIAVLPALAPRFWTRRMGLVALAWTLLLLLPRAAEAGLGVAASEAWHALLIEYLPFATLLLALYTAGGGVHVQGGPAGTPTGNTIMLTMGVVSGLLVGTTAAAVVVIQPLLHANAHRRRRMHLVLFLVVLVANAAGALTPLGNPPLYVGLLRGVPFFWPATHLLPHFLLLTAILLAAFWVIDKRLAATEPPAPWPGKLRLRGWSNVGLILVAVAAVLAQGFVHPGAVTLLGQPIGIERLAAISVFIAVTEVSLHFTPRAIRQANDFVWHPMAEVAMLFAGIFITIGPVAEMLHAGLDGPLAPLLRLTLDGSGRPIPVLYFWLSGLLSAFLDNAPTYLVFFDLAGIRPEALNGTQALALQAISAGATFFGGLTYIGNAPNMMLRAIAAHRGVRMPGFFGFMFWSSTLLVPIFVLLSVVFFR
jgi:Na+/H+ antiporter NhaD/arsenite permease-like protein